MWVTFDNVDVCSDVMLFDDDAALAVVHRVHCVDDLLDLAQVQVLHEVVVQDCLGQQQLCPESCDHSKCHVCHVMTTL